jgi:hypothetical protein
MPVRTGVPRTTHTWLKPLYNYLDAVISGTVASGASGLFSGAWVGKGAPAAMVGNATGVVGFYGFSGLPQILATSFGISGVTSAGGSSGILATGVGGSGLANAIAQLAFNGGTGTAYTLNDFVREAKNLGILPQ